MINTKTKSITKPVIEIHGMHKWFGNFHVLKNISLGVNQGERIVICGPSGSGKSTLIRCINRLEIHQQGDIIVNNVELTGDLKNLEAIRSDVGMVFQSFNLFPHLSILDNCTLAPIWVKKMPKKVAEELALKHLERVQILDQAQKYPGQLSGGQQQRVAIARALCMEPKIMLFDEPTSALDVSIQAQILNLLKDLQEQLNLTILFISHDLPVVRQMCDRIGVLKDGKLCEVANTEDIFLKPQHDYTKKLLHLMPKIESIYN